METGVPEDEKQAESGLTSERREDYWAIILATVVLIVSIAAPEAVHTFFKKILFIF